MVKIVMRVGEAVLGMKDCMRDGVFGENPGECEDGAF